MLVKVFVIAGLLVGSMAAQCGRQVVNPFTGQQDCIGANGNANPYTFSASAVTTLTVNTSSSNIGSLNQIVTACYTGSAPPFAPFTAYTIDAASTTSSVIFDFSSTANIRCAVNSNGAGPAGAVGATGATGPTGPTGGGGGSGATIPATTNVIAGDGAGNGANSGIAPAVIALQSGANVFTNSNDFGSGRWSPPLATFASPPTSPVTNQTFKFTDASAAGTCTGGGTSYAFCTWNGSSYVSLGGGGSGGLGTAFTPYTGVSGTPTFVVTANTSIQEFKISLTGSVTGSTLNVTGATQAQTLVTNICQDATGSRTFVFPTNMVGGGTPALDANSCTRQTWSFDGTNFNANAAATVQGISPTVISGPERSAETCPTTGQRTYTFNSTSHTILGCGNGTSTTDSTVISVSAPTNQVVGYIQDGTQHIVSLTTAYLPSNQAIRSIAQVVFNGGGTALSGSQTACVAVPFAATITSVTLASDISGSGTVDVRRVAGASYTGVASATTLIAGGGTTPSLSGSTYYHDSTLTNWTTSIAVNDEVCFALSSPSTANWIQASLLGTGN